MGRCRVVQPETARLPLSDGDWIQVIQELNAGEYFDFITAMAGREPFAKILAYVVAWSLVGLDGTPIPYGRDLPAEERRANIRSLDKGTALEIVATIDRHEAAHAAVLDAKKKTATPSPASNPLSGSAAP